MIRLFLLLCVLSFPLPLISGACWQDTFYRDHNCRLPYTSYFEYNSRDDLAKCILTGESEGVDLYRQLPNNVRSTQGMLPVTYQEQIYTDLRCTTLYPHENPLPVLTADSSCRLYPADPQPGSPTNPFDRANAARRPKSYLVRSNPNLLACPKWVLTSTDCTVNNVNACPPAVSTQPTTAGTNNFTVLGVVGTHEEFSSRLAAADPISQTVPILTVTSGGVTPVTSGSVQPVLASPVVITSPALNSTFVDVFASWSVSFSTDSVPLSNVSLVVSRLSTDVMDVTNTSVTKQLLATILVDGTARATVAINITINITMADQAIQQGAARLGQTAYNVNASQFTAQQRVNQALTMDTIFTPNVNFGDTSTTPISSLSSSSSLSSTSMSILTSTSSFSSSPSSSLGSSGSPRAPSGTGNSGAGAYTRHSSPLTFILCLVPFLFVHVLSNCW